jgi:hypothetical protein
LKNKFSGWTPVNNDGGAALKTSKLGAKNCGFNSNK